MTASGIRSSWVAVIAVVALRLLAPAAADAAEGPIPLATFFANDQISAVRLSPSGRHVALAVSTTAGRRVLAVFEVESTKPPLVVANDPDADIRSFEWVNDEWLIYNVIDLQAPGSDQEFGPGMFSVKRDGTGARLLIRVGYDAITEHQVTATNVLGPDHGLLSIPRDGKSDVIVGQYQFDGVRDLVAIHPKRLDVSTGRSRPIAIGHPDGAIGWVFDRAGEPRACRSISKGMVEVFWRDAGQEAWRSILKAPALSAPWYPQAVDTSGHLYVVATPPDSTSVLKRFDFSTGKPEPDPIVSTPGFDLLGGLVFDDRGERVVGARVDTDAETTVWFDLERKKLQALADARFPDRVNRTACSACASGGAMLVTSFSDRDPGTFSVYRPETQTWTMIGRSRTAVDPREMATLDLHRIKARDGLELPVWVTTSRGKSEAPRAAVVLVHGGPWVRGTRWRWSADAQFLASRGYVVIEPEYRGSTGFGRRHFTAGFKSWGTTMQDDVADAVKWAADKGLIDGKRVCIAGASYGGYATLMGAIRYPDLYRCGVAWVAVTDPRLMFEELWVSDIGREAREYSMPTLIGDPVKDAAMLSAAAPVEHAGEIKVPILMAFGSNDRRVPLEHGTRMRAAMRAAGNEPEYIVYAGEGHGWLKVENRIDFYQRVEKFLAKNLN